MRTALSGLVALTLLSGLTLYVGSRLGAAFPTGRPYIWAALWAHALLVPINFALMRSESRGDWQAALAWPSWTLFGLFTLLLAGVILIDLGALLGRAAGVEAMADPARRGLVLGPVYGLLASVAGGLTLYGYREARRLAQVVEVEVPIAGLPAALVGLRVAQISDVHVGPTITGAYLRGVVEQVNALSPDLVAVTGDLVDGTVEALGPDVAELQGLKSRHGTFFVTGNHEYYSGAEAWLAELERLGVRTLPNTHVTLDHDGATVIVAGVHDRSAARMLPSHASDPVAAVAGAPAEGLRLLLAHQPRSAYAAAAVGGFSLLLCGHTHAGQYMPWSFFIGLVQPFAAGLHRLGEMWIYTNRGTGYWGPPNRAGVPAEITLLRLVAA